VDRLVLTERDGERGDPLAAARALLTPLERKPASVGLLLGAAFTAALAAVGLAAAVIWL